MKHFENAKFITHETMPDAENGASTTSTPPSLVINLRLTTESGAQFGARVALGHADHSGDDTTERAQPPPVRLGLQLVQQPAVAPKLGEQLCELARSRGVWEGGRRAVARERASAVQKEAVLLRRCRLVLGSQIVYDDGHTARIERLVQPVALAREPGDLETQLRVAHLVHVLGRVALAKAWGATVRGSYPTPEAGTRTQYVLYVGPWGQAALRLRYIHNAGGWYA